jgi:hypothetical protein
VLLDGVNVPLGDNNLSVGRCWTGGRYCLDRDSLEKNGR